MREEPDSIVDAFLAVRGADSNLDRLGLEAALVDALARARAAHPSLKIDVDAFAEHLARHTNDDDDPAAGLAQLRVDELALALACVEGQRPAHAAFEALIGAELDSALARFGAEEAAEARQLLREKVLVGAEGKRPKLLDYAGRGPLGGWLRVVAVRLALDRRRGPRSREQPSGEALADAPELGGDPELAYLRARYREQFREAVRSSLAALEPAERRLLREQIIHGLSTAKIGELHGVHKATAARRLARAREQLIEGVRAQLSDALGVEGTELRSLLRMVRSGLELSVVGLMAEDDRSD